MSGAGADRNPPFNDPKHPGWYTDPQAGQQQGQPAPGASPFSYQPGPDMQPAPQHNSYGGPGYSQPPYYQPAPEPKGLSIGALVCGIVGVVTFGFLLVPQIAAIVLGHIALGREPAGRGMALGGLIMGYVVVGLWTLILMIGVLGAAVQS
ncbi:DUF4190 domain-containing protein [Arthrobacter sp. USHLN218]|uniref:DUF4190 domain-containing protein n=1 Tax=Arthrobacter sp. USHLN218 TaxID=3081232 RepID=UPI003016B182